MKVSGNSDFKHPDPGTVSAICTRIIDLGTQETSYKGEAKKARKVLVAWEIAQFMDDGRPFLVSQRYTRSIHPKAILSQHLESWRGRAFTEEERAGFDLEKVLGAPCLLTLVRDGDYTNVKGVAKLVKGMAALEPAGPLTLLDLDNFSAEVYAVLSDNLKATIAKSPEYKKAVGQEVPEGGSSHGGEFSQDADIPF